MKSLIIVASACVIGGTAPAFAWSGLTESNLKNAAFLRAYTGFCKEIDNGMARRFIELAVRSGEISPRKATESARAYAEEVIAEAKKEGWCAKTKGELNNFRDALASGHNDPLENW